MTRPTKTKLLTIIDRFTDIIRGDLEVTRTRFPHDYKRTWDAAMYAETTFASTVKEVKGFDYESFMKACGLRDNYPQQ